MSLSTYPDPDDVRRDCYIWPNFGQGSIRSTEDIARHPVTQNEVRHTRGRAPSDGALIDSHSDDSQGDGSDESMHFDGSDDNVDDSDLGSTQSNESSSDEDTRQYMPNELGVLNPPVETHHKTNRGGKGVKRGLRKPIEPNAEFKMQLSEAILAFTNSDLDTAELATLRALQINPEMFQAHSLLSEIHAARGDLEKALSAAWNGAHTRPRDPKVWSRLADMMVLQMKEDDNSILRNVIYCCSRILCINSKDIGTRMKRASLNRQLGYKKKAAADYEYILKRLPHDTTVLRLLAECCIESREAQRAFNHYMGAVDHYQLLEPRLAVSISWSDLNIITELCEILEYYEEGLKKTRSIARWILGRHDETYWDKILADDREWDADDERRRSIQDYSHSRHEKHLYGEGLPIEIRVKLGIFRLSGDHASKSEAKRHFAWLKLEQIELLEYVDLYVEAGNALHKSENYRDALQYLIPLQELPGPFDVDLHLAIAACHRALGETTEAETCQRLVLLSCNDEIGVTSRSNYLFPDHTLAQSSDESRIATLAHTSHSPSAATYPRGRYLTLSQPTYHPSNLKPKVASGQQVLPEEITAIHMEWMRLKDLTNRTEKDAIQMIDLGRALVNVFREEKAFYPVDRHHKFYGFTKSAKALAARPKHAQYELRGGAVSSIVTGSGEELLIPDEFLGLPFATWLDIFLSSALEVAKRGLVVQAYDTIDDAFNANIFYHSEDSRLKMQICRLSCAMLCNDEASLCNVARWFVTEFQFLNDGYRLFAAVNRLCDTENTWFNNGRSQKYLLRQLKAVDVCIKHNPSRECSLQERAAIMTRESSDTAITATDLDVGLFMLYGYVLYSGRSFSFAASYFLRALAVDPSNSMIHFSLAMSYIHWSLKRQAENRHFLIIQGLSFLEVYHKAFAECDNVQRTLEAEYNVGRAYHLLGLSHLAIPCYEKCLYLVETMPDKAKVDLSENLAIEAALSLRCIWSSAGNFAESYRITKVWLRL